MALKICIFEDSRLIRESLSLLVDGTPGLELSGAYPDAQNVIWRIQSCNPDVVLMDIEMPGMNGIEAVRQIRAQYKDLVVIMQTVFDDDDKVFEAICAGASGYLLKDTPPAAMMEAVVEGHRGGAPMSPSIAKKTLKLFQQYLMPYSIGGKKDYELTPREKEILQLLVDGHSYKQIAGKCFISFDTVRTHIRNVYGKLHVASSTEAVAKAIRERLV